MSGLDVRGNPRLTGPDANGRAIIVVVADDDPHFVITTFPDDPDLGIEEPIAAVAGRYELDRGALEAAARSALAVPDRVVVLDVLAPAA